MINFDTFPMNEFDVIGPAEIKLRLQARTPVTFVHKFGPGTFETFKRGVVLPADNQKWTLSIAGESGISIERASGHTTILPDENLLRARINQDGSADIMVRFAILLFDNALKLTDIGALGGNPDSKYFPEPILSAELPVEINPGALILDGNDSDLQRDMIIQLYGDLARKKNLELFVTGPVSASGKNLMRAGGAPTRWTLSNADGTESDFFTSEVERVDIEWPAEI
jgi:hypothetical protein